MNLSTRLAVYSDAKRIYLLEKLLQVNDDAVLQRVEPLLQENSAEPRAWPSVMDLFGKLKTEWRVSGALIPDHDIWIAALAQQNGSHVATRETHFQNVRELGLLRW